MITLNRCKHAFLLYCFTCILGSHSGVSKDHSELFRAMDDEILRAMTDLHIDGLPRPYHIEARLSMFSRIGGHATLGTLQDMDSTRINRLTVKIRVGTPKFDNTNFFDVSLGFFGSADDEEVFLNRTVPLELDYATLRRELWLALDACYKQSVEVYAKKLASIKNRTRSDTTWDFGYMDPQLVADTSLASLHFSTLTMRSMLEQVSDVFSTASNIQASRVTMEFVPSEELYATSEGRHSYKYDVFTGFEISATTQALDGMPVNDAYAAYAIDPFDMPSVDSLRNAARRMIYNLEQQQKAVKIEAYSGPVLFTGQAAAEVFAQQFAPNLVAQRAQATEGGFGLGRSPSMAFQNKIGARVLPEFLSVKAQPSMQEFEGTPVAGHFEIDDEGVPTQDITLVDKGYLRNLLSSRTPTKRVKSTNGHYRNGGAMIDVLRVTCSDKDRVLDNASIEAKLLKLVKDRELEYGIIVSSVLDRNLHQTSLYQLTLGDMTFGSGQGAVPLLVVEKIFADGHRETIRGVEAAGFAPATFKDVLAVGSTSTVHNYLAPSVIPGYITGGSGYSISTIITPDLLFEDVEIRPLESDLPKLPLVQSPLN